MTTEEWRPLRVGDVVRAWDKDGHEVFYLLLNHAVTKPIEHSCWRCVVIFSRSRFLVPGGMYMPDDSFLRQGDRL